MSPKPEWALLPRWPELLAVQIQPEGLQLSLHLSPQLVWFRGHFPGTPILAGVAQVHIAMQLASEHLPLQGSFTRLEMLKFQQPLRPDQQVELWLQWDESRRRLAFRYLLAGAPASSGRVQL